MAVTVTLRWPWRRRLDCGGRCCYRCEHYDKFNEAYKVANVQADELRKELRELRDTKTGGSPPSSKGEPPPGFGVGPRPDAGEVPSR